MPSLSEGKYTAEFLEYEVDENFSRESATILSGENVKAGHVLGRRLVAPTFGTMTALGTNVGNGAPGAVTMGANNGARRGTYRIVFVEPATNAGAFVVYGPDGLVYAQGAAATLFNNEIQFTIADGGTDFVAGDEFQVTVTGGTYKYKEFDVADADGGQRPVAVSYSNYDATSADKPGVVIARGAIVRSADLTWFSGATQAQKDAATEQLAALGILVRV